MKNLLLLFICFIASASYTTLAAQNIGYVDTQAIIQLIPEVKEANSNIETFSAQLQKRGQEMLKALQQKYQDLERREAQGEISPKERDAEVTKLKEEENQILLFEQESQQKIRTKSEDLLTPIRNRIQKAIDEVATENSYDFILDYSTGFVLFADGSTNVDNLVKSKLGL